MFSHALLVILAGMLLASFLNTQANAQLNPSSIPLDQRNAWCRSQVSACDTLCSSVTDSNDCTSETLRYTCECTNYPTPILESYSGTIPTLVCLQLFTNCDKSAGTDASKVTQCNLDYGVHCGTKFPVDFEPPVTSSSTPTGTLDASSTDQASTTSSVSSDNATTISNQSTTSSTSSKPTDTLATSTTPKSTPTDISLGAQNTTAPIPANAPQKKGKSDVEVIGMVLGIFGGISVVVLIVLWNLARWRERRDKEKEEAAEAERRSIRSNRGSVLMMREMSAEAIRAHLSKLEAEGECAEKSKMLPKEAVGTLVSPAELPGHFPRSHSRLFEVE